MLEQAQAWWTHTRWFRCETCKWRGRLRDVWDPNAAFPHIPPLRIGRDPDIEFLQQRDEEALIDLVLSRKDSLRGILKVWLDDSRAAPPGWLRVTTVESARKLLEARLVHEISLDYDLGYCADCLKRGDHLKQSDQRHCPHMPTGYDLVAWMAETGHWSQIPPTVHSGNMEGGARMLGIIARQWHEPGAPAAAYPPVRMETNSATLTRLSTCPKCGRAGLHRTHRRSNLQRAISMMTRLYPVRCEACGWSQWSKAPILVRLSPGADTPTERIDTERIEQIDPD